MSSHFTVHSDEYWFVAVGLPFLVLFIQVPYESLRQSNECFALRVKIIKPVIF